MGDVPGELLIDAMMHPLDRNYYVACSPPPRSTAPRITLRRSFRSWSTDRSTIVTSTACDCDSTPTGTSPRRRSSAQHHGTLPSPRARRRCRPRRPPHDAGGLNNVATVVAELDDVDGRDVGRPRWPTGSRLARRLGWLLEHVEATSTSSHCDVSPGPTRAPTAACRQRRAARSTPAGTSGSTPTWSRTCDRRRPVTLARGRTLADPTRSSRISSSRGSCRHRQPPRLGAELAFRGGTCLHKLHLPTALRYSEDLDYVRATRTGVKPLTQALGRIADRLALTVSSRRGPARWSTSTSTPSRPKASAASASRSR